jgi:hypothetical protein
VAMVVAVTAMATSESGGDSGGIVAVTALA